MSKKRELKKLANKTDDAECPLTWDDWKKFLAQRKDSPVSFFSTLWFVAQKYLIKSGAPTELLENPKDEDGMNTLALFLSVNFDEWAPELFRALNTERKKEERHLKKHVQMGKFDSKMAVDKTRETERLALIKRWISTGEFQRIGKHARPILEAYLKDPYVLEDEIALSIGTTRETVSRYLSKIRSVFNPT